MFSRLATVLQELSGEEGQDGDSQGTLVPQLLASEGMDPSESGAPEEAIERLAHLEQLVVQLKGLVRDKDTQLDQKDTELASKDAQLKNEKEAAEARFTKLKLQAKAKMASLNKQISELKGQEGATSPDSSFTRAGSAVEDELQELQNKLAEEEANSREFKEQLKAAEQLLQEKESAHAEQLRKLQAVVFEKDVRFQEQIQKHEEELMRVTTQSSNDGELQQALLAAQRRCEELEEALKSRSQVLEMLQQEVSSADQQKQILTAQFRQMEQELAEAVKLREQQMQQWSEQASEANAALRTCQEALERERMEVARQESELASLREAERFSLEAVEKEKMEVGRLERELAVMKEAEFAAIQTASERDRSEIARLERELESSREAAAAAVHTSQSSSEGVESETDKLKRELASLREEQENTPKSEILAEIWGHLQSLSLQGVQPSEEIPVPTDLYVFLDTVQSIEIQLMRLKDEHREREERCTQLTQTMEALQEQLERRTTEKEEAITKMKQLEQQNETITARDSPESSAQVSSEADKAHILALEQQLLEKDNELVALQESLRLAQEHSSSGIPVGEGTDQSLGQDASTDTQEDDTLVAEDTSVLSISADNESSPELIEHQSESPEESKGTSSDEMVASTDSEVAHSSWTLLEAVHQDAGQDWPTILQDSGQLQMQSWEATSMEQESSTVQVESSSVIIRETVQVHLTQQGASTTDAGAPSGHVFAQVLAEELQKRYSELLAELQRLREAAAESQEKIKTLEEETQALTASKEKAESHANDFAEELKSAKEELNRLSQQGSSVVKDYSIEMRLLEEQVDILSSENKTKEQKIQALQTDMEMAHRALSEQESQARILSVQLEDREALSSELERKLQEMENSMLEYSQTTDLHMDSLSKKDHEICELQHLLSQKEQEMSELNDSMSVKLVQAKEEKFRFDNEVSKLKEQLVELEKQKESQEDTSAPVDDDLISLQKAKSELETQLTNMKKKLQVVLVQRKELLKKVADYEVEAKKPIDEDDTEVPDVPANIPEVGTSGAHETQEMEAKLAELEQALRFKDEALEVLEQKISQQDDVLAETLALNRKLNENAGTSNQPDTSSEISTLQSQVASLEAECETLQKKVAEAQESRKETIRKAKEKDRHHREQLKQQKEDYSELMERFEGQSSEREVLLAKLRELEDKISAQREDLPHQETEQQSINVEKPAANDWAQEDWVDFASSETDSSQPQSIDQTRHPADQSEGLSPQIEESLKALREEIQTVRMANTELENKLQEAQITLSFKETELHEFSKELKILRENERQINALSEEINDLREKHQQAEAYAETLKVEMEATSKATASESATSVETLQAEVEDFKQFLDNKNREIVELGQQLAEQNSLIHSMQDTVSQKDQLIASLQEEIKDEQEKRQKLEVEVPQRQEEEKDSESRIQQLQRKLQAALISRKETLKENKTQKEQLASSENLIAELQQKMQSAEVELGKLNVERARLIDEVDRMLGENQSLGSSCESLKLAMEGVLNEKDACMREAESVKEEAAKTSREWEEKVQGMKDEYETLLKSYENVSDEAERVRRVLEAARQERQELAAKMRTNEAAKQEAERLATEAQKEVDLVKDKMRKFAKTKQQKISELEEENERLRETQVKPSINREDKALKAELDRVKDELDSAVAEKESLGQQIEELREQLAQMELKDKDEVDATPLSYAIVEEVVTVRHSDTLVTKMEPLASEATPDDHISSLPAPEPPLQPAVDQQAETSDSTKGLLEDRVRELEAALDKEREQWQEREAELKAALSALEQALQESKEKVNLIASLEKCLQESKERERCLIEEGSKREAQFKELLRTLETEKDNLEERLMNQLAQLNGSIADYQQEAADNREHLAGLQREMEKLARERAELEAQAQTEVDRAARLEEDMRQAQRQRAEAEAETGKQRELEQQLRSAQRVKEGSQSRARQLEELLREKQLEVRQLQKDCIQYQERISELGREAKALQLGHDELNSKLELSQQDTSKSLEDLKRIEAEFTSCKSQLDETQKHLSETLAEKTTLEQNAKQKEDMMKAEAEQTLDSVRFRLGAELKEIELRLEEAYREREKEEEATLEAREMAEGAERRAQEMQARLDESLARLAAFSRCMSSLQDDRDRVLDEARQWETRFNDALQGREAEVREAETRAKELAEQLQKESALKEQLQLAVDRLEKADSDWQLKVEGAEKNIKESQAIIEEERSKLQQTTTELLSAQNEVQVLRIEVESLNQRARALEEAVGRLQGEVDQARTELREREAEERRLCLNVEQLETDLRSSKVLTENLQTELHEKEKREVEMLVEKEQAVAQAADEARKEAESRAQEAEEELEKRRGELRDVEEKLRLAEEESNNRKTKLDSFVKAMGSLQDDRDRVLNMYKQLEEKHLQVMMEKDGLIQEAARENNSLKEELRSLLVQRDDLYAEKAKLSAQLHGYRDELNQVLRMKDSQHKQLLAVQRERISSLEKEREDLENQLKHVIEAREKEVDAGRVEIETLKQAADSKTALQVIDAPGAEVEKLREQLQAAREQVEALEESLLKEKEEQERKSKELSELKWEGGVMRTESESAQERVAELAQDLLAVEQKLLGEKEVTAQLRAENQSFAKSMASLQDSRDQAENKAQELSLKLEEMRKAGGQAAQSSPGGSTGEVWGLKNALQALQNDRERLLERLEMQTSALKKQKSELARLGAGELIRVSQELFEEKNKNEDMLGVITQLENMVETHKQEMENLRLERIDWMAQAEQLKQQTLTTLSERDQQLRQLTAMLEEARAQKPKQQQEQYQREGTVEDVDSAPGAPQERSSPIDSHAYRAEIKDLQQRLDEEMQQRVAVEEQLMATQDRFRRHSQAKWQDEEHSETAVFIEPSEGAVTQSRRGGPGLMRMFRVAFCSRQRTPLLLSLYLLTVHVVLLLCLGGYL